MSFDGFEIVFFVGPRYCVTMSITNNRDKIFTSNHPVFSLEDFFIDRPDANLHIAIQEIMNHELRKVRIITHQ